MSEKTREVQKFQDTMHTQSLHGETIYEYKLLGVFGFNLPRPMGANLGFGTRSPKTKKWTPGPYGTWKVGTKWLMDLVFMSTFNDHNISIGCIGKLGHLSGFLRHYPLNPSIVYITCITY